MWPTVRRALDWVVSLQLPFGGIAWSQEWHDGAPAGVNEEALLAGSSSIHHSLRAGVALAELVGEPQIEWELAGGRLGHALREHRDLFLDKSTFSMDWYYPVLGGAVRGEAARAMIAERWDTFVEPGLGIRCVSTNPWVTGAETCELVLALEAIGDRDRALRLLADMQHLRTEDGSYWTGYVWPDEVNWPGEHTTYTAAAVILAVDALSDGTAGRRHHARHDARAGLRRDRLECGCASAESGAGSPASPAVRRSTRIEPDDVHLGEGAARERGEVDVLVRRPPAVRGVGEHVVDGEHAAGHHPLRPAAEVGPRRLDAVPAVDEQQRQGRTPPRADGLRPTDDGDDLLLEPGVADRAAEGRQRVHHAEVGVDQAVVVVLPPGLVLLRAAVVVDGEDRAADLPGGRAEPDRRLAAVGADLQRRAVRQPLARPPVQQLALVLGHEALRRAGVREQVLRHHGTRA